MSTVAILSPGDMGHAVGTVLKEHAVRVVTCLRGRSERTRGLAREAGIEDLPSIEELVACSDLILSIVVPAEARRLADSVAGAMRSTGSRPYFADCNAVSPRTAEQIGSAITDAGGQFIDASIIGPPPSRADQPRFYASGPHADALAQLDGMGIQVRPIGDAVGRASGIKMCYAALTKGSQALWVAMLTAAEAMGLTDDLGKELEYSQGNVLAQMRRQVPGLVPKAHRWVGEMEEIAATFEHVGVTPAMHHGAADMYRLVAATPLARETPETLDVSRTLEETIAVIARHLP